MIRIEPRPPRSIDEVFAAAGAKVAAQRVRLAAMDAEDPQRKYEESLLRSMLQNATVTGLLVAIDLDR